MEKKGHLYGLDRSLCQFIQSNISFKKQNMTTAFMKKKEVQSFYSKMIMKKRDQINSEKNRQGQDSDQNKLLQKQFQRKMQKLDDLTRNRYKSVIKITKYESLKINQKPMVTDTLDKKNRLPRQSLQHQNKNNIFSTEVQQNKQTFKNKSRTSIKKNSDILNKLRPKKSFTVYRDFQNSHDEIEENIIKSEKAKEFLKQEKYANLLNPLEKDSYKKNPFGFAKRSQLLELYQQLYQQFLRTKTQNNENQQKNTQSFFKTRCLSSNKKPKIINKI